MRDLVISMWLNSRNSEGPVKHGYSPATDEYKALFRIGPIVFGWEKFGEDS